MDKQQIRLLRPVTVREIIELHPRMTRVVVGGEAVSWFSHARPAAWVKVFFTPPGEPEGFGRAYTISNMDEQSQSLCLDFVQHDAGPAIDWLRHARCGDILRIAGPRDGLETGEFSSWLLFGDETAIPAICAILAKLDEHAHARVILVEIAQDCLLPTCRCDLHLTRLDQKDDLLFSLVMESVEHIKPDIIWGAGEYSDMLPLRKALLRTGRSRKNFDITVYWKRGESDHRDD